MRFSMRCLDSGPSVIFSGGIIGCIFSLEIDLMGYGLHVSRSVMVV